VLSPFGAVHGAGQYQFFLQLDHAFRELDGLSACSAAMRASNSSTSGSRPSDHQILNLKSALIRVNRRRESRQPSAGDLVLPKPDGGPSRRYQCCRGSMQFVLSSASPLSSPDAAIGTCLPSIASGTITKPDRIEEQQSPSGRGGDCKSASGRLCNGSSSITPAPAPQGC